jgi:hypothetical protein
MLVGRRRRVPSVIVMLVSVRLVLVRLVFVVVSGTG